MTELDISLDFLGLKGIRISTYAGVCIPDDSSFWEQDDEGVMEKLRAAWAYLPALADLQYLEWIVSHNGQLPDEDMPRARSVASRIQNNVFAGPAQRNFAARFIQGTLERPETTKHDYQPVKGYVYVLKGGPYYKIGCSVRPDERLNQIQPKLPFETELVCLIQANDMLLTEQAFHYMFRRKRRNGGWFELDEGEAAFLKALARRDSEDES